MGRRRDNRRTAAVVSGAVGAAGLLGFLRGRRERRLKAAVEGIERTVLPPGQTAEPQVPGLTGSQPDEAHAPGHHHRAPPPEEPVPPDARRHPDTGYRSGHRDRGGRSVAFRTVRRR